MYQFNTSSKFSDIVYCQLTGICDLKFQRMGDPICSLNFNILTLAKIFTPNSVFLTIPVSINVFIVIVY